MDKTKFKKDMLCAAFTVAVGVFMLYFSKDIAVNLNAASNQFNSSSYPKLVSVLVILLGLVLAVGTFVKGKRAGTISPSGEKAKWDFKTLLRSDFISVLLILAYVLCFKKVGFIISSVCFMLAETFILSTKENRKPWLIVLISVVFPIVVYFAFTKFFSVSLPKGFLGFI